MSKYKCDYTYAHASQLQTNENMTTLHRSGHCPIHHQSQEQGGVR